MSEGKSFLRKDKPGLVRATLHPEDISKPVDAGAAMALLAASKDQVRKRTLAEQPVRKWPKKSLIKGRKSPLAMVGIDLTEADPDYARLVKLADDYRKHRSRELVVVHGYVSSGVSSLLSTAALSLAASRYLYEKAGRDGDISLLITASKLADSSRQSEITAWELCQREAVARKKAAAGKEELPWLKDAGPGRPKKSNKHELDRLIEKPDGPGRKPVVITAQGTSTSPGSDSGVPSSSNGVPSGQE